MKKLSKFFSMALVMMMGAVMVACEEPQVEPQPEPEPTPTPEQKDPTISVTPGEVGEDWISFTITSANVKRAFYVAVAEDMMEVIAAEEGFDLLEFVLASPNMVLEPNTSWTTTFDGRTPSTKYFVYAAGFMDDKKVLSECVEMTTLAHEYKTTALPEADFCHVTLSALSSVDRYAFALSDEGGNFYFDFNLYTAAGCNGAIPAGSYTVGNVIPNSIDLTSIEIMSNGMPIVVSEGSLDVELYDDGSKIRMDGLFTLVSGDKATFQYDGEVTIMGIDQGGQDGGIVFASVPLCSAIDTEPGLYEIQFQPAKSNAMLNLQIYSDPNKKYLTDGRYPVFTSRQEAEAANMGTSWIYVMEGAPVGSFYQDDMNIPALVLPGMDSYIDVSTNMERGEDYYEITFSLKIKSLFDNKESMLNATYKGALGFKPSDSAPSMTMAAMYVDIDSKGATHTLNFHGGFTSMMVTIEGELPEVGDDYKWFDVVSGNFSDAYAGVSAHPITNGRIAIKRYPDAEDPSDENKVKELYSFEIEGQLVDVTQTDSETGVSTTRTYDLVGEWTSFQTDYSSGW